MERFDSREDVDPTIRQRAILKRMAGVLAGLQVPYSLPQVRGVLGAAAEEWLATWDLMHIRGWTDKDAVYQKLLGIFDIQEWDEEEEGEEGGT